MKKNFIFDFDSTVITLESLDYVLEKSLEVRPDKGLIIEQIEAITNLGMTGEINLEKSLKTRFELAQPTVELFEKAGQDFVEYITPGISTLIQALHQSGHGVFIVSGGFLPLVKPVAQHLGIKFEHCFANEPVTKGGHVVDFNRQNPLCRSGGKTKVVQQIKDRFPAGKTIGIGDGYTDLEPWLAGVEDDFIGFGINVIRPSVQAKAPRFFTDINELNQFLLAKA